MVSIKLKRVDDNITHVTCEDIKVDEQVENTELGTRIPEILELMHSKIMRESQKGIDVQSCIDFFHSSMGQMVFRYGDRNSFTDQHRFKSAKIILRKSIGIWNADEIIEDFLDEQFKRDTLPAPSDSKTRQIIPPDSAPNTMRSIEMACYDPSDE